MKTIAAVMALLLTVSLYAGHNELTAEEKADGWKSLFDGKKIEHWRNFKQDGINPKWVIQDDAMHLTGKGGGDIITRENYENFDFRLEWKIAEAGNSGIFILGDEKGKRVYSHAPEIQILDNERHKDRAKTSRRSGSLYDMIAAPAESQKPAGEWNKVRIMLNKGHLQVWQNDVQTIDVKINGDKWNELLAKSKFAKWQGFGLNKSGFLGLQDHADPVWFRNLKVKVLK
jgi:hypothetical protein